jgi:hypothetical protein
MGARSACEAAKRRVWEASSMASADVEGTRRWLDAYNARDIDAFVAYCDPSVEFHSLFAAVGGVSLYRGHEGVRGW